MNFRVTQQFAVSTSRTQLAKQTAELFKVQQQISSGQRIQRPSDDPAGTRRALIQKDRLERLNTHTSAMQHVQSRLEQAHVQLREAGNLLLRARDIALSAHQITDPSERNILASELDGILEQLVSVANSQDESGYLFSGTASLTLPFENIGLGSGNVSYLGSGDVTQLHLTGDVSRKALLPGDLVFQAKSREAVVVIGNTGAAAGTGVATSTGQRQLTVSHAATTFAAGSGIAAGISSAALDSIIGSPGVHSVQIKDTSGTGAFGTISLNGGSEVDFTSADTDLVVTGPLGEKIYVNTTTIAPGFSGRIDITADGAISIDGGATSVPVTFDANQEIVDSRDGTRVFLNTTQIVASGIDQLEFPGTSDAFSVITELRDEILNGRNLTPSQLNASIDRRIGDLQRVYDHLLDVVGIQSVSLEQLGNLKARTEDLALAEEIEYNDTTATDITGAAIRLQELTNLQQYTVSAVAKILSPNLLNYLQ